MQGSWLNDFPKFRDYVISLPNYGTPKYSLDRIRNEEGYGEGNLRWSDRHTQNTNQRTRIDNKTGYTGVSRRGGRSRSCININKKMIIIGTFDTIEEAVRARNNYIIENDLLEYKIQNINP